MYAACMKEIEMEVGGVSTNKEPWLSCFAKQDLQSQDHDSSAIIKFATLSCIKRTIFETLR